MRILVLSLIAALALGTGVAVAQAGSTLAVAQAGSPAARAQANPAAGVDVDAALVIGPAGTAAAGAQAGTSAVVAQAGTPVPSPMPSPVSIIHIKNFAYLPDSVTIPVGSTVKFVEDDEVPHTVTASDGSFDSGNLNQKQTWTHLFTKAGTYAYYCAYHTYMKGKVIIVP